MDGTGLSTELARGRRLDCERVADEEPETGPHRLAIEKETYVVRLAAEWDAIMELADQPD